MSESPRIRTLLDEVREVLALRGRLAADEDGSDLDERLESLYLALRQETDGASDGTVESQGWSFADLDAQLDQLDHFSEESTPVLPPQREFTDEVRPEPRSSEVDFPIASLASLEGKPARPSRELASLIELLAPPASFTDAVELAAEASKVQWATRELTALSEQTGLSEGTGLSEKAPSRGPIYEVRIGLLAMLAARAQLLKRVLDDDLIPRMTLARLQRFRIEQGLPVVAGLLPTPRPESGTWEQDVRRWWTWLRST